MSFSTTIKRGWLSHRVAYISQNVKKRTDDSSYLSTKLNKEKIQMQ